MAKTIQLGDMTVTAIQAVWAPDYHTQEMGWHLHVSYEGLEPDEDLDCLAEMPHDARESLVRETVAACLFDVAALNEDDQQTLRNMIEVKR